MSINNIVKQQCIKGCKNSFSSLIDISNNMKCIYVLLFFVVLVAKGYAADGFTISVFDKETKKPIPFANVCFEELETTSQYYETTSKEGRTHNPVKKRAKVAISYVGYKTVMDTILPNESKTYYLEQSLFNLEQVIVTGEMKPTLTDSSVYRVKTISAEKIMQTGATNLSELLLTESNIRISADLILGSQIEMMGMDGENVKIMVDGIPVIGRLDGNIDLSQINLSNIDHIEVIEGPMSVVYGNNALAGTINLITKTGEKEHERFKISTQAESVGKYEADFFGSKGFGKSNLALNAQASHFDGVDFNKSTRSLDWKPKTQYLGGLAYNLNHDNWKLNAKLNGYYGKLLVKSDVTDGYKAYDTYYYTERYDGSIGFMRKWGKNSQLDLQAAYNYYERKSQDLYKDLTTLKETWKDKELTQDNKQKILKGSYNRYVPSLKLNILSGIDFNHQEMGGGRLQSDYESLGDYAVFLNLKYNVTDKIEVQPGARYAYNTDFDAPLVYSLNLKYALATGLNWRASFAKGFRAPSLKELYYEFVDSNHAIYGNSDLKAEYSENINTSFSYKSKKRTSINLSFFFNNLHNMITLVENSNGDNGYTYQNISRYKSLGTDFDMNYLVRPGLKVNFGGGLTGRYNSYSSQSDSRKYNLTPDFFAGIRYTEPITQIRTFIDYKFNGRLPFFYESNGSIEEGKQDVFHMLNISFSRNLIKQKLLLTAGARNLLDVTSVKATDSSGGSAHSSGGAIPVSYGRSYFLNLTYVF